MKNEEETEKRFCASTKFRGDLSKFSTVSHIVSRYSVIFLNHERTIFQTLAILETEVSKLLFRIYNGLSIGDPGRRPSCTRIGSGREWIDEAACLSSYRRHVIFHGSYRRDLLGPSQKLHLHTFQGRTRSPFARHSSCQRRMEIRPAKKKIGTKSAENLQRTTFLSD